ncbi:MAG: gas vesicle protein GvpH [Candidatus Spechtbacterales bacterium]
MAKKVHKKENKKEMKFDFGIGKLSLGGIFGGIEKLIELAQKAEEAGGELRKEGAINGLGGRKDVRGVYGFTIRTGLGEKGKWRKPRVESFGNLRKTKEGFKVEETREPIADVFNEKDHVVVVAELPGVSEESIALNIKGDILTVEASDGQRKFAKEILLPAKVNEVSKQVSYKNGVLEVRFKKQGA